MRSAPILIIDDEREPRESLRDALAERGYSTLEVSSTDEALAYLRSPGARVSLILLDCHTEPSDEPQPAVMRALSADPTLRDIPVVILTADERIAGTGEPSGYVARVKKPFSLGRLFELVERYCGPR